MFYFKFITYIKYTRYGLYFDKSDIFNINNIFLEAVHSVSRILIKLPPLDSFADKVVSHHDFDPRLVLLNELVYIKFI